MGKRSDQSVSRRSFVKGASAAGALGTLSAAGLTSASGWLVPSAASAEPEEHVAYLCHQFHCLSGCCLKCTVRDGRIAKIEPNDKVEKEDQRICLRGISEVQHVYATDRLQTPLKRVGERGEGKFVSISWDEAIKTVADAIKESQRRYGPQSVFIRKSTEASVAHGVEWLPSLLHAETGGNWGLDRGHTNGLVPAVGPGAHIYGRSIKEWPLAKTIIMDGHNLCESGMTYAKYMFAAQEAGAKVIVIDPRFSPTASKADQWIAVKPGTDPALMLGLVGTLLENDWMDREFMAANTSFPFLVNRETGRVHANEDVLLPDPHAVTKQQVGTPYVMTAEGEVRPYNEEGVQPVLEGTWTVDGVELSTQLTMVREFFQKNGYTAEWAAQITGVDAQVIRTLADEYANNGPAYIDFGLGGPDKFANADINGHAMGLATALTGNYGKPGCGLGFFGGIEPLTPAEMDPWTLPEEFTPGDTGVAMYEFPDMGDKCPIHCALTFGDAFTLEAANSNKFLDWVKGLDFFAIADIYHSSIVDYADIVLPACTKFENDEDIYHLRESMGYVSLANKAIDPLFESKTDFQIERMIAAEFGLEQHIPASYEEYARKILSTARGNVEGFTVERLLQNQGVLRIGGMDMLPDGGADQVYSTPSKKFEVYYEYLLDQGHQLPVYESPVESRDDNPLKAKYPLQFMQGKTRYRIHAYYSASEWFREYLDPSVNISPADAAARGIKTNDDVRVFNDRGEFVARALVNASIMDGTLFMAETTYNHYYKSGFLQNVTNDARNERCYAMKHGPQILYNDTLVQIEKV
ncbi:molybdopterin-dependent oxidoreductase [Berryella wangjianweii]|uniref:Molybdopterin-dependent oxidoreductase n=1 Tax=Berryella wangjianweii TaxID=2734634 RepID=A0A6M8J2W7_9ACTN|nr:molybdopterin-dependent oxidoreductase [Berryella wangjianweii]QKF07834.1 molybdopterin-dependent oxidoreductase [Berryella wangjianweii]